MAYGSTEYWNSVNRNAREMKKRYGHGRTRGVAGGTNSSLRRDTGSITGAAQDKKARGRAY